MIATEHEKKNKAGSIRKSISIIIAALALIVSVSSVWFSYKATKGVLESSGPNFRFFDHISEEFTIEKSVSVISVIPDLHIRKTKLVERVRKQLERVRKQAEREQCSYLWLIIENVGNSARNFHLISINYIFNGKEQDVSYRFPDPDERWPYLPQAIKAGEAFAILLHEFSDESESENFDKFEVVIAYSIVPTGKEEDVSERPPKSSDPL